MLGLRVLATAAFLAALAALVAPGAVGRGLGWTAIGLVMAGPVLRVVVPARRWTRAPDRRFLAAVAVLLVALCAGALVVA